MKRGFSRIIPYVIHVGSLLPLAWIGLDVLNNHLTANPIQALTQRTGLAALIILILCLAMTPLNTLFRLPVLVIQRRTLGLYAFFYITLHLLIFVGLDYGFAWSRIFKEISEKRFLIAGFSSLIILLPLAVTSFCWWQKKLGKKWKVLHHLVYLAASLAVLHFAWVLKGDLLRLTGDMVQPLIAAMILTLLFFLRLPSIRRWILSHRKNNDI